MTGLDTEWAYSYNLGAHVGQKTHQAHNQFSRVYATQCNLLYRYPSISVRLSQNGVYP